MPRKITLKAEKGYSRVDHFLSESLPGISRTRIHKWLKGRRIRINQRIVDKKNTGIISGDSVEIEIVNEIREQPLARQPGYRPSQTLNKLFEDEYLLVIDKPAGIPVHPGAGHPCETILDIFLHHYREIKEMSDDQRPGIVHRLDRDTSGILILAKTRIAQARMQKKFKKREIRKSYLALIAGKMRFKNGVIDAPLARNPRNRKKFAVPSRPQDSELPVREAVTPFSVLLEFDDSSFIRLTPTTGRTHQIRVHLSHFGNPVLGDPVYGRKQDFRRLALHASTIEFTHPMTGQHIAIHSPLPAVIRQYVREKLKKRKS